MHLHVQASSCLISARVVAAPIETVFVFFPPKFHFFILIFEGIQSFFKSFTLILLEKECFNDNTHKLDRNDFKCTDETNTAW